MKRKRMVKRKHPDILLQIWPGDGSEYIFYVDGTYRCPFWTPGRRAEWKLKGGNVWIRHESPFTGVEANTWYECERHALPHYMVIHDRLETAIFERAMLR